MNEQKILSMLREVNAIITESHIVYTSGKHGSAYVNKDAIYPYTNKVSELCREIAKFFVDEEVEAVVGPEKGAIILSQWVARHLSCITGREVLAVYAEKTEDGGFIIKRGYDKLIEHKRVLVVEDILTTGGSAKKVIEATRALGGNVVGLGVICNRGGIKPEDVGGVPELFALVNITLDAWDEAECPLCKNDFPINTDVGKGREFLARKQA
mgnify:FL=1